MAQDIGSRLKWNTDNLERFQRFDRLGIAYKFFNIITISTDVIHNKSKTGWAVGTEMTPFNLLKLRTGLQENRWTFGTGITLPILDRKFILINYTVADDPLHVELTHVVDFNVQLF